jgi:hypothetical protein
MENPNFDENVVVKVGTFAPPKKKREVFNREKIYKEAPVDLIPTFEDLFKQIDETDLIINYYEILNGKRTKPPRDELLNRIEACVKENCYKRA